MIEEPASYHEIKLLLVSPLSPSKGNLIGDGSENLRPHLSTWEGWDLKNKLTLKNQGISWLRAIGFLFHAATLILTDVGSHIKLFTLQSKTMKENHDILQIERMRHWNISQFVHGSLLVNCRAEIQILVPKHISLNLCYNY